jgi:DNA-binding transcriptional MocR family regulator
MSAVTTGWVWQHSPYRGATFLVHLALGDVANDAHGYELWMSVPNIAAKTRLSDRQVQRAMRQLEADGYLAVVSRPPGETFHYRFTTPKGVTPCHPSPDTLSPVGGDTLSPKLKRSNSTERGVSQMRSVQPARYVPDTSPGEPMPACLRR